MIKRLLLFSVCFVLVFACSEPEQRTVEQGPNEIPVGTWFMYGGQQGLLKAGTLDKEETILVLADSTYSLTYQRPDVKFIFVESGKVYYDIRGKVARFTVVSASGMDWSSGEPRKIILLPESVPFQRDPGTAYGMQYAIEDSLMSLSGGDKETSWFVRAPR